MSTITGDRQEAIRQFVMGHHLGSGLGSNDEPCSIGAINLALGGALSDEVPWCMSPVIGRWIIGAQDFMPDAMRNDFAWKALLPLAAGTGRAPALEQRRLAIILDWMWTKVLPAVQPIADEYGFEVEWKAMLLERTEAAAEAARAAAARAAAGGRRRRRRRGRRRWAAASWAAAARAAAAAGGGGGGAAWRRRRGAAAAAARAASAAWGAEASAAWGAFAPAELLRQLIELSAETRGAL